MKKSAKNKKKRLLILLICILLVIAIPFGAGTWFINHYLNKIDYADTTLQTDPDLVTDAPLPEEFTDADVDIEKNIADHRLWYHDDIINVLLVGCDYGSSKLYYPRSDAVMIASLNKISKVINIVSLSRATYVQIPGHGKARLNAAYAYGGPKLLIQTVELNYKVRIDNYVSVDFEGFSKIIDRLEGISVNLTAQEVEYFSKLFDRKGVDYSKGAGSYWLDGDMALAYARTRSIDTDRDRTQRQRNIINQIISKARNTSLNQATKLLDDFLPLVSTDFSKQELLSQGTQYWNYRKWPVKQAIIPKIGPRLVLVDGYEVLILNWEQVKRDIHEQLYPGIEPAEPLNN